MPEATTCNLCQKKFEPERIPIIAEEPKQSAARLLHRLVEHMGKEHAEQFGALHLAASHYLSVLLLGCFDLSNEVLKQDAATACEFARKALSPDARIQSVSSATSVHAESSKGNGTQP